MTSDLHTNEMQKERYNSGISFEREEYKYASANYQGTSLLIVNLECTRSIIYSTRYCSDSGGLDRIQELIV